MRVAQRGKAGSGPARDTSAARRRSTERRGTAGPRTGRGRTEPDRPDTARGAARPPAARRAAAGGSAKRTRAPRPRGRFTGRAVVLALVLLALILAYAYPVRIYLGQRAQIQQLEQSQAAQRKRIANLRKERAKWDDPDYVRAQARERLQVVRPGEVAYVVTGDLSGNDPNRGRAGSTGPWYAKLWSSVRAADRPAHR